MSGDPRGAEPDDELADQLRRVLVKGLQPVWVEVVDYDHQWPILYQRVADRLRRQLGERARLVEHIGSTSVPGLGAKPVIDVVIGVDDPDDEAGYLPDLLDGGWQLRVREDRHRCLRGAESDMQVNLHCYCPDGPEVTCYLLFRDHLRTHPADRERYAAAKLALAGREWPDMNYYAEAKSPIINEILERAAQHC
jgi:GrpB-like predicted nucleotidyltransferase (UPF0157 family)